MTALMGIAARLKLARLVHLAPDEPEKIADLARAAYTGGADAIMLAENLTQVVPDPDTPDPLAGIREAARATQGLTGYLGRPVRAAQLHPDLVCLLDDEASASRTRRLVGEHTMIGRRTNTVAEVDAAVADPEVDFFMAGPGLDLIRHAAKVAPQHDPASKVWFAVGGVTYATLGAVLRAGAMRAAVGGGISASANPEDAAMAIKDRLREAWNEDPRMEAVIMSAFGAGPKLALKKPAPRPGGTDLHL